MYSAMRAFKDSLRVAVSEEDIHAFASRWPCSGLDGLTGVTFAFAANGDLVDVWYRNGNGERWDGPALVALSHDAQAYLEKRLGHVCLEGGTCVFTVDEEAGDGRINCERCGMTKQQAAKAAVA